MIKRIIYLSLILMINSSYAGAAILVVSSQNNVSSINKSDLKRVFMLKKLTWEDGSKISVINQRPSSSTRGKFFSKNLDKTSKDIQNYYIRLSLTGRGLPPIEVASDREVIDFIKNNKDAIGYISKENLTKDLKVIKVVD